MSLEEEQKLINQLKQTKKVKKSKKKHSNKSKQSNFDSHQEEKSKNLDKPATEENHSNIRNIETHNKNEQSNDQNLHSSSS
jgi:hypothetical protein